MSHSVIVRYIQVKRSFLFFLISIISGSVFSQTNMWAWKKGDLVAGSPGTPGTTGVFAPANIPPGLYGPAYWTGKDGYFYIFGGYTGTSTYGKTLWKYDPHPGPTYNQWMVIWQYNAAAPAVAVGTFDAAYGPGANTTLCYATWVDASGYLWLLDGAQAMWKYDPNPGPTFNQWARMHVGGVAAYGVQGIPSPSNVPPGRGESVCAWTDSKNNLWLFGGQALLNDLWKYDIAVNQWTWMSGDNTINQNPVYGAKGTPNATNKPGSRWQYLHWIDNNDNLWLLGAFGRGTAGTTGYQNDMWRYDPGTNLWTWEAGTNSVYTGGAIYTYTPGTLCVEAASNVPAPAETNEARAQWTDSCGNFWFFGSYQGRVWKFRPSTKRFTLMSSKPNNNPVRGVMGVPAAANTPGNYDSGVPFQNNEGFWFWYGEGAFVSNSKYNDLWLYIPDKPTANYTYVTSACGNGNVNFTSTSVPNCNEIKSYKWDFGDPASGGANNSSLATPSHVFPATGNYSVKLIVTSCTGSKDSITQTINVAVSTPWTLGSSATLSNCNSSTGSATLTISGGSVNYTFNWSNGASTITSAGSNTITGLSAATYTVTLSDAAGCTTSSAVTVTNPAKPLITGMPVVLNGLCPGTVTGNISVTITGTAPIIYTWSTGATTASVSNLNPGVYGVTITDANNCTAAQNAAITDAAPVLINTTSVKTNTSCKFPNGYIWFSVSGGKAPLTYLWNTGSTASSFYSALSAGTYTLTVTDANNCTVTKSYTITGPSINSAISAGQILCSGGTASVTATTSNGTANYTYSWSTGATTVTSSLTNAQTLTAGVYTITITDNNGCTSSSSITLTAPDPITINTSVILPSCATPNGEATALPAGGTGTYTYLWSNASTTQTITGLSAGNYTVTISDANNCTATATAAITSPSPLTGQFVKGSANCVDCGCKEWIMVSASGGTSPYSYSWAGGNNSRYQNGLCPGAYNINITDKNGCSINVNVTAP